MRLLKQPTRWGCGPTSLAMLLDLTYDEVIAKLGHDGSETLFPWLREPLRRRGFSIDEFVDVAFGMGFALLTLTAIPEIWAAKPAPREWGPQPNTWPMDQEKAEERLFKYMDGQPGLICGYYAPDCPHTVAWNGIMIHDPMTPRMYSLDSEDPEKMTIEYFYPLFRIKSDKENIPRNSLTL